jgi:hypothetical protein
MRCPRLASKGLSRKTSQGGQRMVGWVTGFAVDRVYWRSGDRGRRCLAHKVDDG